MLEKTGFSADQGSVSLLDASLLTSDSGSINVQEPATKSQRIERALVCVPPKGQTLVAGLTSRPKGVDMDSTSDAGSQGSVSSMSRISVLRAQAEAKRAAVAMLQASKAAIQSQAELEIAKAKADAAELEAQIAVVLYQSPARSTGSKRAGSACSPIDLVQCNVTGVLEGWEDDECKATSPQSREKNLPSGPLLSETTLGQHNAHEALASVASKTLDFHDIPPFPGTQYGPVEPPPHVPPMMNFGVPSHEAGLKTQPPREPSYGPSRSKSKQRTPFDK